jgi:hypothetical protein
MLGTKAVALMPQWRPEPVADRRLVSSFWSAARGQYDISAASGCFQHARNDLIGGWDHKQDESRDGG